MLDQSNAGTGISIVVRTSGFTNARDIRITGTVDATGSAADTDTVVASAKAYVNALNRLIVRRQKSDPDSDVKVVSYKDAG